MIVMVMAMIVAVAMIVGMMMASVVHVADIRAATATATA
jgi:hypothetical protein